MALVARGERLEELRNSRGLTQDEVPFALKEFNGGKHVITRRGWQLWVAGHPMAAKRAKVVAAFFDVDQSEISDPELSAAAPQLDRIEGMLQRIVNALGLQDEDQEPPRALPELPPISGSSEQTNGLRQTQDLERRRKSS